MRFWARALSQIFVGWELIVLPSPQTTWLDLRRSLLLRVGEERKKIVQF